MNRPVAFLVVVCAAILMVGPTVGTVETVYFEQDFENESTGTVVYQTDFASGPDGWRGWPDIYFGSVTDSATEAVDSKLRTTIRGSVHSTWNNYHLYQQRHIEVERSGTYHLYARANVVYPPGQYDDSVNFDRFEIAGRELPVETGREAHYTFDVGTGNHSLTRRTQFTDADGGRVNGSVTLDHLTLLRDSSNRVRNWESMGFPLYTDTGIEGSSLFLRSATAAINASPAQHNDPVVVAFDVRTTGTRANWTIEQTGHTIAEGVIAAEQSRTVRRRVSLQRGVFTLALDSRDTLAVDNVRVLGYRDGSATGDLQPSVPALERATPERGYDTLLGGLNSVLSLGLDTATYLALGGLAIGSVLFVIGRRRDGRGLMLLVGASTLLVCVLLFAPLLETLTWIVSGQTDQPSLEDPDLSATSILFREAFDSGSLAASEWNQVSGRPSDAFIDSAGPADSTLVLREGAAVERTVPVTEPGVRTGFLTVEARVASAVGEAPPDEDAMTLEVGSDGSAVLRNTSVVVATGGDTVSRTLRRRFALPGSTVTIRIGARDTNGGDDRARVDVDTVSLRGET